jgi:hypothetical protein
MWRQEQSDGVSVATRRWRGGVGTADVEPRIRSSRSRLNHPAHSWSITRHSDQRSLIARQTALSSEPL